MAGIMIDVKVSDDLQKRLAAIRMDNLPPSARLGIYNTLAKKCDPYVPMQEGTLAQTVDVTPDGVTYNQPYARYQYYGEVYGPNIPIIENGIIVGWFSPPNQKKHPTGRSINYSKEKHPLATSFWDKAMMRDHGDEFEKEVHDVAHWVIENYERRMK